MSHDLTKIQINIDVPDNQAQLLEAEALKQVRTRSNLIKRIIFDYLFNLKLVDENGETK